MVMQLQASAAAGTPANIDTTYIHLAPVTITAGGVGVKGSYVEMTAPTGLPANVAGVEIIIQSSSAASAIFLIDIATDTSGSADLIKNIPMVPNTVGQSVSMCDFRLLNIPAGTRLYARCQSGTAAVTCVVSLRGEARTANHPPLYNNIEELAVADTTNTRASVTGLAVTTVAADNTGWTTYLASTGRAYGGLTYILGRGASAATNVPLLLSARIGVGGSGATDATFLSSTPMAVISTPTLGRGPARCIKTAIPAASRVAFEVVGATPGDAFQPRAWGYY